MVTRISDILIKASNMWKPTKSFMCVLGTLIFFAVEREQTASNFFLTAHFWMCLSRAFSLASNECRKLKSEDAIELLLGLEDARV